MTQNLQDLQTEHTQFIKKLADKKFTYYQFLHNGKPTFYHSSDIHLYYAQILMFKELEDIILSLPNETQNYINECVQKKIAQIIN